MNLKQTLSQTRWRDVALALVQAYPKERKSLEGFRRVYTSLMDMEAGTSELTIVIEPIEYEQDTGRFWYDVYGTTPEDDGPLAIEFRPWREWLGMGLSEGTAAAFTPAQTVAHCLHEMTFFGFDERKVQSTWKAIGRDVKEVLAGTGEFTDPDLDVSPRPWTVRDRLRELSRFLRLSFIAKEYFGKSARWFQEELAGKESPDELDEIDRAALKGALEDIAREIRFAADRL